MKWLLSFFTVSVCLFSTSADPSPIAKDSLPEALPFEKSPLGLKPINAPESNPITSEKIALGRALFFDPILSGNQTVACASCHDPAKAFAGPEAKPKGIHGTPTKRKAPALINRAFGSVFFWDGRVSTLEEQALQPIEDPDEMGAKLPEVIERLKKSEKYNALFQKAFSDGVTQENLAKALATFQRVLLKGDSPVDRFTQKGERKAMTEEQLHGFWLYESKGFCWKCHSGSNFTDESFRNTGVSWGQADLGRFQVTQKESDKGKFKTPTLRGVATSGPYMHDGSLKTLEEVVDFYDKGGNQNPHLDQAMKPLKLTAEEKKSLVAFLKALSE
jgi:cytochrome c peroxidase